MRRSRSSASSRLAGAGVVLLVLFGAARAVADPILDALDDEVDLAEAVVLLDDLLGAESEDRTDLVETVLRDAAALRAEPLDLNAASFSDLVRVPLIDAAVAAAIIARRDADGPFGSLDALEGIGGVSRETVLALRPYLFVAPEASVRRGGPGEAVDVNPRTSRGRVAPGEAEDVASETNVRGADRGQALGAQGHGLEWSLRVRGSTRSSELRAADGDLAAAATTCVRLRVSSGGLEAGFGCQKDPGESTLLDHSAFFVRWERGEAEPRDAHHVSAIAGDFVGAWGQGLVLSGSGFTSARNLPRLRDRTRGYDGASESASRRGLVVEISRGRARVAVVGARTRLDAAIDERGRATTIRSSGYHRTEGERLGANALGESLVGVRAVVGARSGWQFGASFLRFRYDPILASGDLERLRFRFEGSELEIRAADVRLVSGAWRLGVEVAGTSDGGRAALACVRVRRGSATVRLGFGHLSRSYWSPLGGGMPGFSSGGNGIAGWIGAEYRVAPRVRPWVRLTVAGRPWRSYSDELPGGFRTWSGGLTTPVARLGDLVAEVRVRTAAADRGDPPGSVEEVSRRMRATLRASGGPPLSFFLERVSSSVEGSEEGTALALGVRAEIEISRTVSLAVGVTQVARRGGARPLVQYEPALPGEFGLRSLSGSGARWYARVVAGLTQHFGLSFRIGGGPGRERSEIGVAIDTRGS